MIQNLLCMFILALSSLYYCNYASEPVEDEDEASPYSASFFSFIPSSVFFFSKSLTSLRLTSRRKSFEIGSPIHWLLKISLRKSIYFCKIFLSPRAATWSYFKSELVNLNKLSPVILLYLNSSRQSPNPIWFNHSPTSSFVHSLTVYYLTCTSFFNQILVEIVWKNHLSSALFVFLIVLFLIKI